MDISKITFFLPVKGNLDILRVFNILIPSIKKYFLSSIEEFYIICTSDEYEQILGLIKNLNFNLNFKCIVEDTLIRDTTNFKKLCGWKRQQLLKLEFAKICNTNLYLVLDSDVFMIRECYINDFFVNKKIIYNCEENCHTEWWVDSCKLLNYDYDLLKNKCTFGVTPCILIKNIVLNLFEYLNLIDYNIFLKEEYCNWTEYTLYWLYVINNNYNDLYMDKNYHYKIYGYAIWNNTITNSINDISTTIINNNKDSYAMFSLVQSNSNIISNYDNIILFKELIQI
jgi:hypothetical protein